MYQSDTANDTGYPGYQWAEALKTPKNTALAQLTIKSCPN